MESGEVEGGEVVRAKGGGVFGEFDSVGGVGGGEGGEVRREIEFVNFTVDATSLRILFVRSGGRILFVEEFSDGRFFG